MKGSVGCIGGGIAYVAVPDLDREDEDEDEDEDVDGNGYSHASAKPTELQLKLWPRSKRPSGYLDQWRVSRLIQRPHRRHQLNGGACLGR